MKRLADVNIAAGLFLICFNLLLVIVHPVSARQIAGVAVDESVTMENKQLVLNGAGIRKKFFVKVYVGALYLTGKLTTAEAVMADPGAKRIIMSFLHKEVSAAKLADAWNKGFIANHTSEELRSLRERINRFNSLFRTVYKGDEIRLDYLPEDGTRVWINNSLQGTIPGDDFHVALLKIWLGREPADSDLKDAMLGGEH